MDKSRTKEPWIDIVKWVACMLVAFGTFFPEYGKKRHYGSNKRISVV